MPSLRRLSGFAILSLLSTSYWLAMTLSMWRPAPLWSLKLIAIAFLGCGFLFAASLLMRPVAVSTEFALNPRTRACSSAGPPAVFDRVLTSVTVALVVVIAMSVPFAVGLVVGLLGMRQASRSHGTVGGYALAAACSLASFVGALVFLASIAHQAKAHSRAVREWTQCKDNVIYLAAVWKADGGSWHACQWCDMVGRHRSGRAALVCPAAPELDCGYAFNAALTGVPYDAIENPRHTVAVLESDEGWNAAGGRELLPDEPRHFGKDDYVFADGHVDWLPRKHLPDGTWAKEPEADWVIWEPVLKTDEEEP